MTITFEINMASLVLGRHVRLFVVDDVLSKLKGFSFNKGKVKEVIVRIGSSLHFHREKIAMLHMMVCGFVTIMRMHAMYTCR